MSDPNIKTLYRKYMKDIEYRSTHDKETYVVYPCSTDESESVAANSDRLNKILWETRKANWVPLDAETFFNLLKNKIQKLQTIKIRDEIRRQYGNIDDEELDRKIEKVKWILQTDDENGLGFLKHTVKA